MPASSFCHKTFVLPEDGAGLCAKQEEKMRTQHKTDFMGRSPEASDCSRRRSDAGPSQTNRAWRNEPAKPRSLASRKLVFETANVKVKGSGQECPLHTKFTCKRCLDCLSPNPGMRGAAFPAW